MRCRLMAPDANAGAGRCSGHRAPSVVSLPPMATVLMPLPACDFDPTEVAVSWQVLSAAGHDVVFATPSGQPGRADDLMVTGRGLDPWGAVPGLRRLTVVGRVLRANADARRAYAALLGDEAFASPLHWGAARRSAYDALVLPGGHRARGMRPYLESPEVQQMAIDSFRAGEAGRGDLPRRPGGGARGRPGRPGARCCTAGGPPRSRGRWNARPGASPAGPGSGTPTTTGPTWRSRASAGATCRCSRR